MDFKAALLQLKKVGPKASLPFLYVEADAKGKPAILVGNSIASEKSKVLAGVKTPKIAAGTMSVSGDNELILKAKGNALGTLKSAAAKAGAAGVVKAVTIGSPDPEEATGGAPGQNSTATPTPAPASGGWQSMGSKPPGQAPRVNLGSQRGALPDATGQGKTPDLDAALNEQEKVSYVDSALNEQNTTRYVDTILNDQGAGGAAAPAAPGKWTAAANPGRAAQAGAPQPPAPPARPILPAKPVPPAKKFPDVLRQSPAMAKLLDQREILRNALADTGPNPKLAPERREAALAKLAEMEAQLETAQRGLNETGFVPRQVGAEYAGEHEKVGWRAAPKPVMPSISPNASPEDLAALKEKHAANVARWEKSRDSAVTVTRRFDEDEQAESELSVNEDGRILDAEGNPLNTSVNTEYVMDAADGKLHQFEGGDVVKQGNMVPNSRGRMVEQKETTHHSSVLGGGEVAGAGGLTVVDGKLQDITNVSGHYKPGVGHTLQTVETLLKQGALLDKEWADKDGKPLAGKVGELYQRCKAMQQKVAAKLQDDPDADVAGDRKSIDAAMAMLAKLGAGPRNSIRGATVGMLDIKKDMTGADVRLAEDGVGKKVMSAQDFLRTGGGNQQQADAKKAMQEQLRDGMAGDRERLEEATKHGVGTAAASDQELAAAASDLEGRITGVTNAAPAGGQTVHAGNAETAGGATSAAKYTANPLSDLADDADVPDKGVGSATGAARYTTNPLSDLADDADGSSKSTGIATDGAKYTTNPLSDLADDADDSGESAGGATSGAKYTANPLSDSDSEADASDKPADSSTRKDT